jgi:hypothetical protein
MATEHENPMKMRAVIAKLFAGRAFLAGQVGVSETVIVIDGVIGNRVEADPVRWGCVEIFPFALLRLPPACIATIPANQS